MVVSTRSLLPLSVFQTRLCAAVVGALLALLLVAHALHVPMVLGHSPAASDAVVGRSTEAHEGRPTHSGHNSAQHPRCWAGSEDPTTVPPAAETGMAGPDAAHPVVARACAVAWCVVEAVAASGLRAGGDGPFMRGALPPFPPANQWALTTPWAIHGLAPQTGRRRHALFQVYLN